MVRVLSKNQLVLTNLGKARKYLIQSRHWLEIKKVHSEQACKLHLKDMDSLIVNIDGLIRRYKFDIS